jgi:tetratricopeptide (TPR) repeat protein
MFVSPSEIGERVPEFGHLLALHQTGQLVEAAAGYRALAEQPALTVCCLHQLALVASQQNDAAQAIHHLQHGLALAPGQPLLLQTLAAVLERAGRIPEALDSLLELGCAFHQLGDKPQAVRTYQRMLAVDILRYGAWANLGTELCHLGDPLAGAQHLYQAVLLAGRRLPLLTALATQLQAELAETGFDISGGQPLPAGHLTGAFDKIDEVLTSLGKALSDLGHPRRAIACHRLAIEMRPAFQLAHWNLALALLAVGEYEEGWKESEWRWLQEPTLDPRRLLPIPHWQGQPAAGKRLMIFAEQGYGDVVQFAPLVRTLAQQAEHIVFQVYPALSRLLAHHYNTDRIEVIPLPAHPDQIGTERPLDGFAPLLSLPHLMGLSYSALPLLQAPLRPIPEDLSRWRERLGPARQARIGIVWAGRPEHANDRNRSLPAETLAQLLALPGIDWVSLQVGPRRGEFATHMPHALDLGAELQDFADTAAVIELLDGVVAVDTAVAHLAASLHKPVWLMLPFAPDWRWGETGETTPWYPHMRLYRQTRRGDWHDVVSRLAGDLAHAHPIAPSLDQPGADRQTPAPESTEPNKSTIPLP